MSNRTVARSPFRRIPPAGVVVGCIVLMLTALGLVVLFSTSRSMNENPAELLRSQLTWLGVALACGVFVMLVNLEALRSYAYLLFLGSIVLLGLVLIPALGVEVHGARRWLELGPMRLQVSEIGKLGLLFGLSHYLAAYRREMDSFVRGFLIPLSMMGAICVLILLEPDFGTAFLCGLVGGTLLYLGGARLKFLVPAAIMALAAFSVAVYNDPVRLERITAFLNLEENRSGSSYQLWQGILAFGSGGTHGVGLGEGRQQLQYLPEAHTDFIFAIVGEELGLFFTAGIVLLFLVLFLVGMHQLRRAPNLYQYLLVTGALLFIIFQALINIGVVTGCLPTKGMSLPFISYGGSNLVFMFVLIGLLLNGFRSWELPALRRRREI
ncbi:MAG: FtsW/RodA/SpoVE family cell cycle protein [Opitutales bacterium]